MNQNFKLIKASCISKGGITETATDIRLIIKEAVLNNATRETGALGSLSFIQCRALRYSDWFGIY
jgi:hypothetical protein